ncbi:DRTGG domain protein [Oleidesulfovibrio alaskensis G20]|jgi:BioD-like phosphotransacetylase family protein|uniref:DRTGG domain protein n=1 Tax=Oleidesulfovibrio alaskensis (strain ATCC BAA-1058 / DSM 17464 / G20) TaxID=207559 RepID=Q310Z4_OLEA2|nr:phosphotransacetylase family protein [Oleidesulfovibrio alaskensis]ABB38502.1 DRTGG domain protein [Oleidesulfovibrio alaskensis G20]MBG0773485.1 phosphotransacetylase family protein [Oleidesulfovibrio alaskensis]MBL3580922.1 phosphotransacetylase family protein [Oleidesulfovibrio alaskensis]MBL3587993.1 phosphotransacetylase family protein [bacterium]
MAAGIYIGSTSGYSGKNMVVMGLGMRLQKDGYNVGYMKPVGAVPQEMDGVMGDEDAFFVQSVLGLEEPAELVTPVVVTQDFRVRAFSGQCGNLMPSIAEAYDTLQQKRDVMLVAGSGSMYSGRYCNVDGIRVVKELGLKAVIIDRLHKELNYDYLVVLKDTLGDSLAGVILNDIPANYINEVDGLIKPFLESNGVKVLGVIPKDPLMGAIKVGDLAERLGGKVISAQNKADKVVENFLIGTMQVENFMTHFRKNKNSAVIVGGDRSDVQLVALEGNCPCLVLTGNLYPNDIILTRSEVLNIPIVVVRDDTYTVAKKMEVILSRHKLRDVIKIRQGAQLVSSSLDFAYLKEVMGI